MTDATSSTKGTFVWRDLMTPDPKKSVRFYGELFNWEIKAVDMGGTDYHLLHATKGGKDMGGIMQFSKAGAPAHWVSYVSVEDVDATAKTAVAAGGKVLNPASDIPNVGRFVVLGDPQGAVFVGWKSAHPGPAREGRPQVGEFCWEQLGASSVQDAEAFYGKVLGWTTQSAGDNGRLFLAGEKMVATVNATPPGVPPNWVTFVAVEKLSDANIRVTRLGGTVLMADIKAPGYGTMSIVRDDVGAVLGMFQSE